MEWSYGIQLRNGVTEWMEANGTQLMEGLMEPEKQQETKVCIRGNLRHQYSVTTE